MTTRSSKQGKRDTRRRLLQIATHLGALLPLMLIIWDLYSGRVGPDPIREVTLRTGKAAITLLMLSLAVTPLNTWFGLKELSPLRRPLGLYAFMYVAIHLSIFVWVDYGLDPILILDAVKENQYVIVGLLAFLILLPMAITSTRGAMRRLGKRWKQLHSWVYLAGILAVLHYFLLVKNSYTAPLLYGVILAVLLITRINPVRRRIVAWRQRMRALSLIPWRSRPADQSNAKKA
jgi:sulfoxide reductase heme-binding subunit YedZ